ncbi:protein Shroom4 isoform X4 [Girardinichthys multiradiatus]|uniref:protein Shroom4 isoform X4 n=1 Tax=Girardinichthys multiradiatus TaxID=208333 RepID=UPI001FAE2136|nr:protein Shroom4 isoform X4 [Girardinichthys multiradiatus]
METVEQLVSFNHIQVQLNGGAPWGFTLKGGLEHGEPLIITKIEDGGKAAHCKRLKVGDELININGSALYGSRQEALILIKGSYRILKLTVRRRSIPVIRPHSWHLSKLLEPLPPPPSPPPLTPRLPPADSPPLPPPPPPSAMQLHSGSYSLAWHTTNNSDLSVQWTRPYSSTDRSSSQGSMESLDTPTPTTQPYSDSHNSPVDPTLFNNKRDSAYSSFSASSNTSDYATVLLRPGEASSMDNLLQSLGPAYQGYPGDSCTLGRSSGEAVDEAHLIVHKSRSLTRPKPRPVKIKERPSSCCYEQDQRGGALEIVRNGESQVERKNNPPQPPTRKDSFRVTRSCTNTAGKRCTSAPIEICSSYCKENLPCLNVDSGIQNGFPTPEEGDHTENLTTDSADSHFSQRQTEEFRHIICGSSSNNDSKSETTSERLFDSVPSPTVPITPSGSADVSSESSTEVHGQSHVNQCLTKHSSSGLQRHSAPEKLLTTQLQLLQFNSNGSSPEPLNPSASSDPSVSPCSGQWSHASSLQHTTEDPALPTSHKLEGSRSSTPGSVFLEVEGEAGASSEGLEVVVVNGKCLSPVHHHAPWGRSVSVPGEPSGSTARERLSSDQILESDFQPLSAAASVDTLLDEQTLEEEQRAGDKNEEVAEREESVKKPNSSKNHRRNRRRSERFATNLRNEIQRKKAQLQRGHGPGGLLCSRETVHEEEGSELCEDGADPNRPIQNKCVKVILSTPAVPRDSQTSSQVKTSNTSRESDFGAFQTQTTSFIQGNNRSRSVQILDPGVPSFGVGFRVVEEPAPAGKARRWRWTPEHKLQPEQDGERLCGVLGERSLGVTGSSHGVCAFTSSSSSSSSYSRSSLSSRTEESDILPFADRMKFFEETSKGMPVSNTSKRSSYRQNHPDQHPEQQTGELGQDSTQRRYSYQGGVQQESVHLLNNVQLRRQSVSAIRERQKEMEREKLRDREERQQEPESQERELEMERARLREIQRGDSMRQWERERERKLEREKEAEKERVEHFQPTSHQDCYSNPGFRKQGDIQHTDQFHNQQAKPYTFSHCQNQNKVPQSAFYPIIHHQQPENQESLHHGYNTRSYTPTETFHAPQQETTKLNRKYSLTERDYSSWRRESRPPQTIHQQQHHHHQALWDSRRPASRTDDRDGYTISPPPAPLYLRGRAMSENDLRFESSHRWSPSIYAAASQTLSEMEEGGVPTCGDGQRKKKTPPPPRPPPPKWEQFHRRRASHHTLLASSTFAAPQSITSSFNSTEGHYSAHSSSYVPPPDASRQRSYSLPPERQEVAETCSRCSCSRTQAQEQAFPQPSNQSPALFQEHAFAVAPPSPMFSRKAFRPVAPPHVEREDDFGAKPVASLPPPPPAKSTVSSSSGIDASHSLDHKPQPSVRPGADWETPPSPRVHSPSPGLENGRAKEFYPKDAYFSQIGLNQQQQVFTNRDFKVEDQQKHHEPGTDSETTLSPSPAHSLEAELEVPLETDIDDFQELPAEDTPITSELPCFAQPVTVLETDIDTLPDPDASPSAETLDGSSSLEEEELELFPQSGEGESGTDSWRGACQSVEHNTNSLDSRQSGASSSSYYHTSAAKAQLLSQMKDFTDSREKHEDDELTYKKQLMESLRKKLGVLREAQKGLQEDIRANAQLGDENLSNNPFIHLFG